MVLNKFETDKKQIEAVISAQRLFIAIDIYWNGNVLVRFSKASSDIFLHSDEMFYFYSYFVI